MASVNGKRNIKKNERGRKIKRNEKEDKRRTR